MSSNRAGDPAATSSRSCPCGCFTRPRRYPSDLTDEQWQVLAPLLPVPLTQTPLGGRPEKHHRRTVLDAIFYLADNGIKWRALPADFPPWRTVYGLFAVWAEAGIWARITHRLRTMIRIAGGRHPQPSGAITDAQSVHESGEGVVPRASSGSGPHKKVNGRKRHLLTDTGGLLIAAAVTPASTADRDAAAALLQAIRPGHPGWPASGPTTPTTAPGPPAPPPSTTPASRSSPAPAGSGFTALPRRWVIERTLAWITRRRRCARDYERTPAHHLAMIHCAAIIQMTRRLALTHPHPTHPKQPL
jgi:putative transposase